MNQPSIQTSNPQGTFDNAAQSDWRATLEACLSPGSRAERLFDAIVSNEVFESPQFRPFLAETIKVVLRVEADPSLDAHIAIEQIGVIEALKAEAACGRWNEELAETYEVLCFGLGIRADDKVLQQSATVYLAA